MSAHSDYEIMQNDALSALLLWKFVDSYLEGTKKVSGPSVVETIIVLPAVYNEKFTLETYSRQIAGGLYRAQAENKTLSLGLNSRVSSMMEKTMRGLNLAFASKILAYDPDTTRLSTIPRKKPEIPQGEAIAKMVATSRRLGLWCAEIKFNNFSKTLGIGG